MKPNTFLKAETSSDERNCALVALLPLLHWLRVSRRPGTRPVRFTAAATVVAVALCFASVVRGGTTTASADAFDAGIAQLSRPGTTINEVLQLLGEPQRYVWGQQTFEKSKLPATYIAQYPRGVQFVVQGTNVVEIRCQPPGPGFTWNRTVRLGSSLSEVLAAVGPPGNIVTGKPQGFAANVLYRDIEGEKGRAYYSRPDQHVRFFFQDDKVAALFVTLVEEEESARARPLKDVQAYDDVHFKDLSAVDLSARASLPATLTFNQKTVWPPALPAGIDPKALLSAAMNPGLGIRELHRQGITGKGVNVAIIDQPLFPDHPEFAGKIAAYQDLGCKSDWSMHGPAVLSLLLGTQCGTAPDARVYYAAAPSWTADTAYQAKALDWIVEQNARLAPNQKIRVVSVSAAPSGPGSPFTTNTAMWDAACDRATKAGILVLDCTTHRGFVGPCYYDATDPENVSRCEPGFPGLTGRNRGREWVLVPCSPRTTAEEYVKGEFGYQYCGRGGLSWAIPYCAGVLAMGWQVRPDLDGATMRTLLFNSAHKKADGSLVIDPPEFIRVVKDFTVRSK